MGMLRKNGIVAASSGQVDVKYRVFKGSLTRDLSAASGDVSYAGVGFKPHLIIFMGAVASTTKACWGIATEAGQFSLDQDAPDGVDWMITDLTQCIGFIQAVGDLHVALLKSMDADGFTLTWAKSGAPTGSATIGYVALG